MDLNNDFGLTNGISQIGNLQRSIIHIHVQAIYHSHCNPHDDSPVELHSGC